MEFMV